LQKTIENTTAPRCGGKPATMSGALAREGFIRPTLARLKSRNSNPARERKNRNRRKSATRAAVLRVNQKTNESTAVRRFRKRAGPANPSARLHRMGWASMPNKKMNADGNKNRSATVASRQSKIKAMNTKKNLRFGPNTNKMQTRNFSLRSKHGLHPIHGGLRPPSLFLIGTKIWHTSNLD
jgi:hypothetical protein